MNAKAGFAPPMPPIGGCRSMTWQSTNQAGWGERHVTFRWLQTWDATRQ